MNVISPQQIAIGFQSHFDRHPSVATLHDHTRANRSNRNRSRSGSLQTCLLSGARTDAEADKTNRNGLAYARDYSRFGLGGSVSLPSVLEPVADLGGGEARLLRQLALLPRGRVGVLSVPLTQDDSGLLLEAVARLLAVPYGSRKGELAPNAILAHGTQRLSA